MKERAMTIKDINPIEFAEFLRDRINALDEKKIAAKAGHGEWTVCDDSLRRQLQHFAIWAARHIFGDDNGHAQAYRRMCGDK